MNLTYIGQNQLSSRQLVLLVERANLQMYASTNNQQSETSCHAVSYSVYFVGHFSLFLFDQWVILFPLRLALIMPPRRNAAAVAFTHSSFSSRDHRAAIASMFCFTASLMPFKSPSHCYKPFKHKATSLAHTGKSLDASTSRSKKRTLQNSSVFLSSSKALICLPIILPPAV